MKKRGKRLILLLAVVVAAAIFLYRAPARTPEMLCQMVADCGQSLLIRTDAPLIYDAKDCRMNLLGHATTVQIYDFSGETMQTALPGDGAAAFASLEDLKMYLDWFVTDETANQYLEEIQSGTYCWWEFQNPNRSGYRIVFLWSLEDNHCMVYENSHW